MLQSTNENKYEDHINCVNGPEELAEQIELVDIMYSGAKTEQRYGEVHGDR